MEKAVGALRVLQTFWGSNEPQSLSESPAGIAAETPSSHRYHQLVKREEGDQNFADVYQPADTPETHQQDAKPTDSRAHVTHPASQGPGSLPTYLASAAPPRASQERHVGPVPLERSDVAHGNGRLETPRRSETTRERDLSSQSREIAKPPGGTEARHGTFNIGDYSVRPGDLTQWIAPGAEYGRYSDDEVRSQPDIVFEDGTLTMPLDGPHLRDVIRRIEKDRSLCFKMRWYVARHVRHHYTTELKPSTQHYRRRVYRNHNFARQNDKSEQLVSLRDKPFNRLDFEATRIQEHFSRNQPGFQIRTITQVLQRAYDQYGWDETVTDENVDDVLLLQADSDLRHWVTARRMKSPYQEAPTPPIVQQPLMIATAEPPRVTPNSSMYGGPSPPRLHPVEPSSHYSMPPQSATHNPASRFPPQACSPPSSLRQREAGHRKASEGPPGTTRDEEIALLRAEIRELKAEVEAGRQFRASFVQEQRASQEALMAEMRSMLEAAEHGRKRKRHERRRGGGGGGSGSDKKQLPPFSSSASASASSSRRRKSKSQKMRKYVQKLQELDAQSDDDDDGSLSSSSSASAAGEELPADSGP